MIGLAYGPDGGEPEKYVVATLAALRCKNNVSSIDNPIPVKGLLDGFIDEDQAYYLQQLQEKYRTCKQLDAAFPINQLMKSTTLSDSQEAHQRASNTHQSFWHQITLWFKPWLELKLLCHYISP